MKTKEMILENLRHTLHNFKHLATSRYVEDAIDYIESINHYGTPPRQELPSVEELGDEMAEVWNKRYAFNDVAQHLVNKYKLPSQNREWWMDLKEGDKFNCKGKVYFFGGVLLNTTSGAELYPSQCTPYIEPFIHDKVKEKLGNELYEEFMKEVNNA